MPKGIPYIISNEAAERFSFYGMKGILFVFLTTYFVYVGGKENFSATKGTVITSMFNTAAYLTPLLGALIADTFFGKYKTIIRLSIVYCLGHLCLAFVGVTGLPQLWLLAGLGLISLGAGGIKPCVSAHVGDQFGTSNQHLITKIFNIFYFSINTGAAIANIAIPIVLLKWGPHWAFGIPGVLMAIATVCFWMGRQKFIHVPAHGKRFIDELKSREGLTAIGKLIPLYLFVAIFWCLFDQTANTLVHQAESMNRNFFGFEILPSQIKAANPFLILVLIPIFTFVIYPFFEKRMNLTPLKKIGAGLFIMVISFAVISLSQESIDKGGEPHVAWQLLAYVIFTSAEILISIVCLEFSYTQAPKKMKSFIMGLFLASVSFGNLITASISLYIQIPEPEFKEESNAGYDGNAGTPDDLKVIEADEEKKIEASIESPVAAILKASADRVVKYYDGYKVTFEEISSATDLPSTGTHLVAIGQLKDKSLYFRIFDATGKKAVDLPEAKLDHKKIGKPLKELKALLATGVKLDHPELDLETPDEISVTATESLAKTTREVTDLAMEVTGFSRSFPKELDNLPDDPWGNPLRYLYVHKKEVRILSDGPDKEEKTRWDLGVTINVKNIEEFGEGTWIYKQKKKMGLLEDESKEGADDPLDVKYTAGGGLRLEGAAYFWFFTILMLVTALLFIPFSFLYKPRTYLQDESTAD